MRVNSNTNDNVYNASDEGYTIKEHIGAKTENSHEFVLENIEEDQLFVSMVAMVSLSICGSTVKN